MARTRRPYRLVFIIFLFVVIFARFIVHQQQQPPLVIPTPSQRQTLTATSKHHADDPINTNDNKNSHYIQPMLPFDLEKYLSTFVAANPQYTEDCKTYLRSPQEYNKERNDYINWRWHFSQYNQDWFMFVNFFHSLVTTGRKGFYVESGTNHWMRVSNTALYDLCLGWDGICVEPSGRYHAAIQKHRTCKLEKYCLADKEETIFMNKEVPGGESGTKVNCVRMDYLLDKHNVTDVTLWSLDIEGFEFKALAGVDWNKYHIQGLLMEQQDVLGVCNQFPLDYRLTTLGYHKYRMVSDGFYWKSDVPRFPNPTALDTWFLQLETKRCKEKQPEYQLKFFTDPPPSSATTTSTTAAKGHHQGKARRKRIK